MILRPMLLFLASIFHQAQVNGQWKRIKRSQLVLAHISAHKSMTNFINFIRQILYSPT